MCCISNVLIYLYTDYHCVHVQQAAEAMINELVIGIALHYRNADVLVC